MTKKLDFKRFVERSKVTHPNQELLYDESTFDGSSKKTKIICRIHGEFWQKAQDHMKGQGCPKCYHSKSKESKRLTEQVFNERIKQLYDNNIACDYKDYENLFTKMPFICVKHGTFYAIPSNVFMKHGCPTCGKEKYSKNRTTAYDKVLDRMVKVHDNEYAYFSDTYSTINAPMKMLCHKHGEFWQSPYNHYHNNQGCPLCKESTLEKEIETLLSENNIEFIRERKLERQHIDFFIPSIKLNIECQGGQHFGGKFYASYNYNDAFERDIRKFNKVNEMNERIIYYTRKEHVNGIDILLDNRFNGIYSEENLFFILDDILRYIKELE